MYGDNRERRTLLCRECFAEITMNVDPDDIERKQRGELVQRAFADRNGIPYLNAGEREMYVSGICNTCWQKMWKRVDQ